MLVNFFYESFALFDLEIIDCPMTNELVCDYVVMLSLMGIFFFVVNDENCSDSCYPHKSYSFHVKFHVIWLHCCKI